LNEITTTNTCRGERRKKKQGQARTHRLSRGEGGVKKKREGSQKENSSLLLRKRKKRERELEVGAGVFYLWGSGHKKRRAKIFLNQKTG